MEKWLEVTCPYAFRLKNCIRKAYGQVTPGYLLICFLEKRVVPKAYGEVTWSHLHVCFAVIKRGTSVTLRFFRPRRAQWFGEVFSPNSIALLSTAAKSEREEWNTCGGTCTYAFRYLMGCFNAVSASTLAQNEAEKIYKKSKNVLHYCVGCIILFI